MGIPFSVLDGYFIIYTMSLPYLSIRLLARVPTA
jgi:hypothetical protein